MTAQENQKKNSEVLPYLFCEKCRVQFKSVRGARLHLAKTHVNPKRKYASAIVS